MMVDPRTRGVLINTLEDFRRASRHQHREAEYFSDGLTIFRVPDSEFMIENFIIEMGKDTLYYHINWDDPELYDSSGIRIPPVNY